MPQSRVDDVENDEWGRRHIKWQSVTNRLPNNNDRTTERKMTKMPKTRKLLGYLRSTRYIR